MFVLLHCEGAKFKDKNTFLKCLYRQRVFVMPSHALVLLCPCMHCCNSHACLPSYPNFSYSIVSLAIIKLKPHADPKIDSLAGPDDFRRLKIVLPPETSKNQ